MPNLKDSKVKKAFEKLQQQRRKLTVENIDYWKSICPNHSISSNPFPEKLESYKFSNEESEKCIQQLKLDGYFQTEPLIPEEDLSSLEECIRNVTKRGQKSSYALLFDEFYAVISKLKHVLTPILGDDYQLVLDEPEAYYVSPEDSREGTLPHRDSLRPRESLKADGLPSLLNTWVAITDATHLNSCIYVVLGRYDPGFPLWNKKKSRNNAAGTNFDLRNIRALPMKAGSVLGWTPHLLHWGGRCSQFASGPRMSMSMYHQSRNELPFHSTTMDIPSELPFAYRLYIVEKVWQDPKGESTEFEALQQSMRGKRSK